jgi:hypothetical protein
MATLSRPTLAKARSSSPSEEASTNSGRRTLRPVYLPTTTSPKRVEMHGLLPACQSTYPPSLTDRGIHPRFHSTRHSTVNPDSTSSMTRQPPTSDVANINSTQISIIASWAVVAACIASICFGWSNYFPYLALLFSFIRGKCFDEKAEAGRYLSNRLGMSIAVMVSSITPFAWYLYRLVSRPNLPDGIGKELLVLSVPLLVTMLILDHWLYLRNMGMKISAP